MRPIRNGGVEVIVVYLFSTVYVILDSEVAETPAGCQLQLIYQSKQIGTRTPCSGAGALQ